MLQVINDGNTFGVSRLDGWLNVGQPTSVFHRGTCPREMVVLQVDHEQCLSHAVVSWSSRGGAVLGLKAVDSIWSTPKVNVRSRDIDAAIRTHRQGIGPTQSLVRVPQSGGPVGQNRFTALSSREVK